MSFIKINERSLFYEITGTSTETIVLVHGSWIDHHSWDSLVPYLSSRFRVITYDRRGHSLSQRTEVRTRTEDHISDLNHLIEELGGPPVHVVGNSFGGSIVLNLVGRRPDLFKKVCVHEPPLASLGDPAEVSKVMPHMKAVLEKISTGQLNEAAILFVEKIALGPGTWHHLSVELQKIFVLNAPTFLDEQSDPNSMTIDLNVLSQFERPVLITKGDQSPPFFEAIVEKVAAKLRHPTVASVHGAGHIPHLTHAETYARLISEFISSN